MQQILSSQTSPEIIINENFESLSYVALFSKNPAATTGLQFSYYGGTYKGQTILDGVLYLASSNTNYVVVDRSTGAVSATTTPIDWANFAKYARLYIITTNTYTIANIVDYRVAENGGIVNLSRGILPQLYKVSNYNITLEDAGTHILHPNGSTAATYTIPWYTEIDFPLGTTITFVNMSTANLTIAINNDILRFAGTGATGSRVLARYGKATVLKIGINEWLIDGINLT